MQKMAEVIHDQQLGRDKTPDRYANGGRETIDRIRDIMTDQEFVMYCLGQVIRYRDRAGKKGPADVDEQKAQFYFDMAQYVRGEGVDPRSYREGFEEYRRQDIDLKPFGLTIGMLTDRKFR